jgi:hypothetical protein
MRVVSESFRIRCLAKRREHSNKMRESSGEAVVRAQSEVSKKDRHQCHSKKEMSTDRDAPRTRFIISNARKEKEAGANGQYSLDNGSIPTVLAQSLPLPLSSLSSDPPNIDPNLSKLATTTLIHEVEPGTGRLPHCRG